MKQYSVRINVSAVVFVDVSAKDEDDAICRASNEFINNDLEYLLDAEKDFVAAIAQ